MTNLFADIVVQAAGESIWNINKAAIIDFTAISSYSYFEPGYYQFVDSNAGKLDHFLTYLQHEFSLNVYQDMTPDAETPIRAGKTISQTEYYNLRDHGFIDSGEKVVQLYGDFTSYTAILTDKRIGDYFPRSINLGDSLYEFVWVRSVRQVNLNFSSWGHKASYDSAGLFYLVVG